MHCMEYAMHRAGVCVCVCLSSRAGRAVPVVSCISGRCQWARVRLEEATYGKKGAMAKPMILIIFQMWRLLGGAVLYCATLVLTSIYLIERKYLVDVMCVQTDIRRNLISCAHAQIRFPPLSSSSIIRFALYPTPIFIFIQCYFLWPALSPDLNPGETVWNLMKDYIEKILPEKLSYDQLCSAGIEACLQSPLQS